MIHLTEVLVVVPARIGSVRISGKNFRPFAGGACLTDRAVDVAWAAGFTDIVVSTDHVTYTEPRVQVDRRPASFAQAETPMFPVLERLADDHPWMLLLQPTSPLRTVAHLHAALAKATDAVDSVLSCRLLTQGYEPVTRVEGTFYLFRMSNLTRYRHLFGRTMAWVPIPAAESLSIDTEDDWAEAERRVLAKATRK